ncbi:MAG TPA: YdeI/OmpD-associated family protein [Longimicrobiales bacterium]|nr:YdeI/OmpD-associated family protein [Longimicrobiales bacterium]
MKPTFFAKPADFGKWLAKNHATETELSVGYYKKGSGKPSMTWPESVAEALCYGWIDGVRHSYGDDAYTIRFTPRKPTSIWSAVNTKLANQLIKDGLMKPAGLAAFKLRDEKKTSIYAFEQKHAVLPKELDKEFRANREAWKFFQAQPPGYKKLCMWFIISAKRDETRRKRLAELIADSAAGRRLGRYSRS